MKKKTEREKKKKLATSLVLAFFNFPEQKNHFLYIKSIFYSFAEQQINVHGDFASFHAVLTSQITQLLKGQVSKGFASCPVPQKEV